MHDLGGRAQGHHRRLRSCDAVGRRRGESGCALVLHPRSGPRCGFQAPDLLGHGGLPAIRRPGPGLLLLAAAGPDSLRAHWLHRAGQPHLRLLRSQVRPSERARARHGRVHVLGHLRHGCCRARRQGIAEHRQPHEDRDGAHEEGEGGGQAHGLAGGAARLLRRREFRGQRGEPHGWRRRGGVHLPHPSRSDRHQRDLGCAAHSGRPCHGGGQHVRHPRDQL
mmetsp:Transcript_75385/g.211374  ORF Transcript_75385/g.211374 Transcript_75385/m.211374 type:complete len:222 (+) Transcript_75385:187-852(+)